MELLWAPSQYKDGLSRYGNFHYNDRTVVRRSYLYTGNSYTGKTTSLCWDGLKVDPTNICWDHRHAECLISAISPWFRKIWSAVSFAIFLFLWSYMGEPGLCILCVCPLRVASWVHAYFKELNIFRRCLKYRMNPDDRKKPQYNTQSWIECPNDNIRWQ